MVVKAYGVSIYDAFFFLVDRCLGTLSEANVHLRHLDFEGFFVATKSSLSVSLSVVFL